LTTLPPHLSLISPYQPRCPPPLANQPVTAWRPSAEQRAALRERHAAAAAQQPQGSIAELAKELWGVDPDPAAAAADEEEEEDAVEAVEDEPELGAIRPALDRLVVDSADSANAGGRPGSGAGSSAGDDAGGSASSNFYDVREAAAAGVAFKCADAKDLATWFRHFSISAAASRRTVSLPPKERRALTAFAIWVSSSMLGGGGGGGGGAQSTPAHARMQTACR
jgi:hypothetical protein